MQEDDLLQKRAIKLPLDKAADAHRELDKKYLGKLGLRP